MGLTDKETFSAVLLVKEAEIERLKSRRDIDAESFNAACIEIERLRRENEDLTDFIRGVARQLLERARAGTDSAGG